MGDALGARHEAASGEIAAAATAPGGGQATRHDAGARANPTSGALREARCGPEPWHGGRLAGASLLRRAVLPSAAEAANCWLTFELRRPERTVALPDGPTMTAGLSGKAAGRGGSPLERGVRPHGAAPTGRLQRGGPAQSAVDLRHALRNELLKGGEIHFAHVNGRNQLACKLKREVCDPDGCVFVVGPGRD